MQREYSQRTNSSSSNYPLEGVKSITGPGQKTPTYSTANFSLQGTPLIELLLDDREIQYYHGKCSQRGVPIMRHNAQQLGRGRVKPGTWIIRYSNLNTFCLTAKASSQTAASKHTAPDVNGYFHWPFKILGTHRKEISRIFILFVSKYTFDYYDNGSATEGTSSVDEHVRLVYTSFEDFACMCFKHWGGIKFDWINGVKKLTS